MRPEEKRNLTGKRSSVESSRSLSSRRLEKHIKIVLCIVANVLFLMSHRILMKSSVPGNEFEQIPYKRFLIGNDARHQKERPLLTFPPQCTTRELSVIRFQLPKDECVRNAKTPYGSYCSFSYATRCPDAKWLQADVVDGKEDDEHASKPSVSIFVGCNKAMDAVNELHRISRDPTFDRDLWRDTLFKDMSPENIEYGRCQQDFKPNNKLDAGDIIKTHTTNDNAIVHCIEAMPVTATQLDRTAKELGWSDRLVVYNAAMAQTDGTAWFPNLEDKIGAEAMGLSNCEQNPESHIKNGTRKKKRRKQCLEVPLYRLDTFADKFVLPNSNVTGQQPQIIDFISVDVEGYDLDVLLGAPHTLCRTRYIEFEYNWKGNWGKTHNALEKAIRMLKNSNFVCYWAGSNGWLWRITDCWLPYYNFKFWSNVACVNTKLATSLFQRMEQGFQATLAQGTKIRYDNETVTYPQ